MTHPLSPRFLVMWAASIAAFWIAVWGIARQAEGQPRILAAMRMAHTGAIEVRTEMLWRYKGSRPGSAEELRVFWRQANAAAAYHGARLVAYLGTAAAPDAARKHFRSEVAPATNYFDFQTDAIPAWPAGSELWVGFEAPENAQMWLEVGEIAGYEFDARPFYRQKGKPAFQPDKKSEFGSLSARVAPKGEAMRTPDFAGWAIGFLVATLLPLAGLRNYRRWWIFWWLFQGVLLWKAIEVLLPSQHFWGAYYHSRISAWCFWPGLAAIQLLTFPWIHRAIARSAQRVLARAANATPRAVCWAALGAAAAGFFAFVSANWSLGMYGDGYGALAVPGYDYHNPFATAIYHVWRDAYFSTTLQEYGRWLAGKYPSWTWIKSFASAPRFSFADVGIVPKFVVLFAPLYVLFIGLIARDLGRSRTESLAIFAILALIKPVLTHFGYVEVYGPSLAVQAALIWVLLRSFVRGAVVGASGLAFFGYLFHLGGAMALPAVAALWVRGLAMSQRRVPWLATRAAATAFLAAKLWLLCLAALFIFKHDGDLVKFFEHVPAGKIPFVESSPKISGVPFLYGSTGREKAEVFLQVSKPHYTHSYTLFDTRHASQFTGAVLFLAGPLAPWLLAAIVLCRRRVRFSAERWGMQLAALAFFASAFFLSTNFPYPKDWDVFSIQALWWAAVFAWCVARGGALPSAPARWALWSAILYLAWDTIPWVAYNLTWGPQPVDRYFVFY